ncbi:MAG TPA: methyltransferase domain-containing protein [Thermoanaerobaculia bacterium]|jgi:2-polyprenyl-3-methyl-5-hydroxy-6-metoxy-1,4-benzoquinol methylase|nr:methyltransferase domain-containing protein [Thermoanaerobaculia bacterium]
MSGFATARKILGSQVDYRMENVYNLAPKTFGKFDVVLFLGVLYHLRKPLAALDSLRSVMKDGAQLFVGTMLIDEYFLLPQGNPTSLESVNPVLKTSRSGRPILATRSTATSRTVSRRTNARWKSRSRKRSSASSGSAS